MPGRLSGHPSDDLSLGEHGEALVQPEVLKVFVGHQISGPAVSNLVGNHGGQASIPGLSGKKQQKILEPCFEPMSHLFSQAPQTFDALKVLLQGTRHFPDYLPLGEDGEPLIEPEVLEVGVGHQVAGPAVSDLVSDQESQGLVSALVQEDIHRTP